MNRVKKVVVIYWKFQYLRDAPWYSYICKLNKTIKGHGAMLLYSVAEDYAHLVPDYPFDDSLVEILNQLVAKYFYNDMENPKYNNKKDVLCNCVEYLLEPEKVRLDLSNDEIYHLFLKKVLIIDVDTYISWLPNEAPKINTSFTKREALNYGFEPNTSMEYFSENRNDIEHTLKLSNRSKLNQLYHVISDFIKYNTYVTLNQESKIRFVYVNKSFENQPYTVIPCKSYFKKGIDYDRIVNWWINVNNTDRLKYIRATDNCCKIVAKGLRFGGATEFDKSSYINWNPYDLYEYSKKLRSKILQSPNPILPQNKIRFSEPQLGTLIWSKEDFYNSSFVSKYSHRYTELKNIDKLLDKVQVRKLILNNKINKPLDLAIALIEIKKNIAKILFKRPLTKRYHSLHSLLIQCDKLLDKIEEENQIKKNSIKFSLGKDILDINNKIQKNKEIRSSLLLL